ncbi:Putative ankyrin repeat protein [Fulvia fulva]|uniref:Ankyrin repeat protein n=1 Tax=Passalora fulva TaxID=5499 RepID=A0A9Q8P2Y9_PASFU|nr:Putative ankyrin repeat protein [Fulvia fulva]KAK4634569.1 putative ankyrin repeat protein [Fulvia fulva]KAK4637836.1 putative ankyrin repeat protein [Fulvia fulva]UJO11383.1 Putative ankyrin repeat protein [Fulvia fulva]WPV08264.1 Putative ankyrin repeat protein [Fulvia fulva]WPV24498.1 Putative ankyrin repeat protein [Fulvia fulva]
MGFDTMRSFHYLGLYSIPQDPVERHNSAPETLRRRDSFMVNDTTRHRQSDAGRTLSRSSKPASLPVTAPPFQAATAKWSPPSSPGALSPSGSPTGSPRYSPASPATRTLTTKEKNALANQLFEAACSGDLAGIEILLSQGAAINSSVLVGGLFEAFKPAKAGHLSPLAGAASHGQRAAVELLLARGADLNPDSQRCASSPLHEAVRNNDMELTRLLLDRGADVNISNAYKTTPLMYATKYGSPELVTLVLQYRPNLHTLSFINAAAIHWSVWPGNTKITKLLLKAGADPNQEGAAGNTPLGCAVMTGSISMVQCLLQYGADPMRRNEAYETAFDIAESQSAPDELIDLLHAAAMARRCS